MLPTCDHMGLLQRPRAGGLTMLEIDYTDVVWSILFKNVMFVQIGEVVSDLFNFYYHCRKTSTLPVFSKFPPLGPHLIIGVIEPKKLWSDFQKLDIFEK